MFLFRFRQGEPSPFPLTTLEKAFDACIEFREPRCWGLLFPDGGRSLLYLSEDTELITNFCLNRPVASAELWQGILEILRETSGILFWPDGGVVAHASVIDHLPPSLIESLGRPTIVSRPGEIIECIEKD